MMFDFIDGASGDESLRDLNSAMIDHIRLMPRVLIDVSERAMSTSILGQETGSSVRDRTNGYVRAGMAKG